MMTTPPHELHAYAIGPCFHRGEYVALSATLETLRRTARAGRLTAGQQRVLLELAQYGLFYTRYYENIARELREQVMAEKVSAVVVPFQEGEGE